MGWWWSWCHPPGRWGHRWQDQSDLIVAGLFPERHVECRTGCKPGLDTLPPQNTRSAWSHYSEPKSLRNRENITFHYNGATRYTTIPLYNILYWLTVQSHCQTPQKRIALTSFRVVALGSVVPRAKALPMMHHHSGQLIQEVFGAWWAWGGGAEAGWAFGGGVSAAVGLHVEKLVKADMNAYLLPVVAPRPPAKQPQPNVNKWIKIIHYRQSSLKTWNMTIVLWLDVSGVNTWSVWGAGVRREAVCGPLAVFVLQSG